MFVDDLKTQITEREKAETALRQLSNGLETQVRVRTEDHTIERATNAPDGVG